MEPNIHSVMACFIERIQKRCQSASHLLIGININSSKRGHTSSNSPNSRWIIMDHLPSPKLSTRDSPSSFQPRCYPNGAWWGIYINRSSPNSTTWFSTQLPWATESNCQGKLLTNPIHHLQYEIRDWPLIDNLIEESVRQFSLVRWSSIITSAMNLFSISTRRGNACNIHILIWIFSWHIPGPKSTKPSPSRRVLATNFKMVPWNPATLMHSKLQYL